MVQLDRKRAAVLAVSVLLLLAVVTLLVMRLAGWQGGPELTDTERLRDIGVLWGLEWPRADCPDDIPSAAVYNSHQDLEASFQKAGGWRMEIERELVHERVERWRGAYALWVQDAESYARMVPDSEDWAECKFRVDTIAHRGRRVLNQVDALLR